MRTVAIAKAFSKEAFNLRPFKATSPPDNGGPPVPTGCSGARRPWSAALARHLLSMLVAT
jgi:hypothetical protein